jgi:hypothetical protein
MGDLPLCRFSAAGRSTRIAATASTEAHQLNAARVRLRIAPTGHVSQIIIKSFFKDCAECCSQMASKLLLRVWFVGCALWFAFCYYEVVSHPPSLGVDYSDVIFLFVAPPIIIFCLGALCLTAGFWLGGQSWLLRGFLRPVEPRAKTESITGSISVEDYRELIARAVAQLNRNTKDARREIYDRARKALISHLRAQGRPEFAIAQHLRLLEAAVRSVELKSSWSQPLAFPITLRDERKLRTLFDAAALLTRLTEKTQAGEWDRCAADLLMKAADSGDTEMIAKATVQMQRALKRDGLI